MGSFNDPDFAELRQAAPVYPPTQKEQRGRQIGDEEKGQDGLLAQLLAPPDERKSDDQRRKRNAQGRGGGFDDGDEVIEAVDDPARDFKSQPGALTRKGILPLAVDQERRQPDEANVPQIMTEHFIQEMGQCLNIGANQRFRQVADRVSGQMHALALHPQGRQSEKSHHLALAERPLTPHLKKQPVERHEDQRRQEINHIPVFHERVKAELLAEESRGDNENSEEDGKDQRQTGGALHFDSLTGSTFSPQGDKAYSPPEQDGRDGCDNKDSLQVNFPHFRLFISTHQRKGRRQHAGAPGAPPDHHRTQDRQEANHAARVL